jgi:hypothetical protein
MENSYQIISNNLVQMAPPGDILQMFSSGNFEFSARSSHVTRYILNYLRHILACSRQRRDIYAANHCLHRRRVAVRAKRGFIGGDGNKHGLYDTPITHFEKDVNS